MTKTFDTVNRDTEIRSLELSCVVGCWMISKDNEAKKKDILAPTLFSIFFSVMLTHAFQHSERGILLEFGITGVFDLRRFNLKSKIFHTLIKKFSYADDIVWLTHTVDDIRR